MNQILAQPISTAPLLNFMKGTEMETFVKHPEPHVSVVILTYNQKEATLACLKSFQSVTYPNMAIFIVDNGSTDGTTEAVSKSFPSVHALRSATNLGCAGGRNFGAHQALKQYDSKYLLFIDNDTGVRPDFLIQLVKVAKGHKDTGIVTGKILNYDNRQIIDAVGNKVNLFTGKTPNIGYGEEDIGQYDSKIKLQAVCSCCHFIPTEVWQQLNGYDTGFDPYGYEDLDLCMRTRQLGKQIYLSSKSIIYHKKTQTLGGGEYISTYTSIKGRNMRRFLNRHARLHHKIGFFIIAPFLGLGSILRAIRSGDPKAAFRLFSSFFFSNSEKKDGNTGSNLNKTDH